MTTGTSLEKAVRSAVRAYKVTPVDKAAAELAATYARQVDQGGDLAKLGPLLLAALDALGLTPRARAALVKGATGGDDSAPPAAPTAAPGTLDEIRQRRARKGRAAAVDAAAP